MCITMVLCCGFVPVFGLSLEGSEEVTPVRVRSGCFQCTTRCNVFVVNFLLAERTRHDFPSWNRVRPCWVISSASAWPRNWVKYQTLHLNWLTSSTGKEEMEKCAGVGCDAGMCWPSSLSKTPSETMWGPRSESALQQWGWMTSKPQCVPGEPHGAWWCLLPLLILGAGPWYGTWAPISHKGILQVPLHPLIRNNRTMEWFGWEGTFKAHLVHPPAVNRDIFN